MVEHSPSQRHGRLGAAPERAAPLLFLCLWSGGYVAARTAVQFCPPITLVAVRFALTLLIFLAVALALRAPWPRRWEEALPIAVSGLLIQGFYFTGSYLSFARGMAAGPMALLLALQPVLTACVAGRLLGERVTPRQWIGLVLGFFGVTLVLGTKLAAGVGTPGAVFWAIMALLAITIGTLFQKRFCPVFDLWTGGVIQFAAASAFAIPAALLLETPRIVWTPTFGWAFAYLVLGNSIVAVSLLNLMIRRGEAARVTSLLYLVPGGAALLAWLLLGETMSGLALLGLLVGAGGVALVLARRRPA